MVVEVDVSMEGQSNNGKSWQPLSIQDGNSMLEAEEFGHHYQPNFNFNATVYFPWLLRDSQQF